MDSNSVSSYSLSSGDYRISLQSARLSLEIQTFIDEKITEIYAGDDLNQDAPVSFDSAFSDDRNTRRLSTLSALSAASSDGDRNTRRLSTMSTAVETLIDDKINESCAEDDINREAFQTAEFHNRIQDIKEKIAPMVSRYAPVITLTKTASRCAPRGDAKAIIAHMNKSERGKIAIAEIDSAIQEARSSYTTKKAAEKTEALFSERQHPEVRHDVKENPVVLRRSSGRSINASQPARLSAASSDGDRNTHRLSTLSTLSTLSATFSDGDRNTRRLSTLSALSADSSDGDRNTRRLSTMSTAVETLIDDKINESCAEDDINREAFQTAEFHNRIQDIKEKIAPMVSRYAPVITLTKTASRCAPRGDAKAIIAHMNKSERGKIAIAEIDSAIQEARSSYTTKKAAEKTEALFSERQHPEVRHDVKENPVVLRRSSGRSINASQPARLSAAIQTFISDKINESGARDNVNQDVLVDFNSFSSDDHKNTLRSATVSTAVETLIYDKINESYTKDGVNREAVQTAEFYDRIQDIKEKVTTMASKYAPRGDAKAIIAYMNTSERGKKAIAEIDGAIKEARSAYISKEVSRKIETLFGERQHPEVCHDVKENPVVLKRSSGRPITTLRSARVSIAAQTLIDDKINESYAEDDINREALKTDEFLNKIQAIKEDIISLALNNAPSGNAMDIRAYIISTENGRRAVAEIDSAIQQARSAYITKEVAGEIDGLFRGSVALCKKHLEERRGMKGDLDLMLLPFSKLSKFMEQELLVEYSQNLSLAERDAVIEKVHGRTVRLLFLHMKKLRDEEFVKGIHSEAMVTRRFHDITTDHAYDKAMEVLNAIDAKINHCYDLIKNDSDVSAVGKQVYADMLSKDIENITCDAVLKTYLYKMAGANDSVSEDMISGADELVYKYEMLLS